MWPKISAPHPGITIYDPPPAGDRGQLTNRVFADPDPYSGSQPWPPKEGPNEAESQ